MKLQNEFQPIRDWAQERNLFIQGDKKTQLIKLGEEFGELSKAILSDNQSEIEDAIGDMVVVLTNLSHLCSTDIETCINNSYNVIKNRKGKIINNTFVKE